MQISPLTLPPFHLPPCAAPLCFFSPWQNILIFFSVYLTAGYCWFPGICGGATGVSPHPRSHLVDLERNAFRSRSSIKVSIGVFVVRFDQHPNPTTRPNLLRLFVSFEKKTQRKGRNLLSFFTLKDTFSGDFYAIFIFSIFFPLIIFFSRTVITSYSYTWYVFCRRRRRVAFPLFVSAGIRVDRSN